MTMETKHLWSLLFAASFILCSACSKTVNSAHKSPASVDVTATHRCDFESNTCGFSYNYQTFWYWSGEGNYPDFNEFPGFYNTSNYLWSQDWGNVITASPHLLNIQNDTSFSCDYFGVQTRPTYNLDVYFNNEDKNVRTLLKRLPSSYGSWSYVSFTCGTICCSSYPCNGYFEFMVESYFSSLSAIDNVKINFKSSPDQTTVLSTAATSDYPTPKTTATTSAFSPTETTATTSAFSPTETTATTSAFPPTETTATTSAFSPTETTATTSAAPPRPGCCDFTTDTCGFSYRSPPQKGSWEWSDSGNTPNSTLFPLFPGVGVSYIFTQNDDDSATYSALLNMDEATKIGLMYYVHIDDTTGTTSLRVYFENSDGSPDALLDVLDDTDENWLYRSLTCGSHDCCESYPCTGRIKVVAAVTSLNALYAIDEVEINNACSVT